MTIARVLMACGFVLVLAPGCPASSDADVEGEGEGDGDDDDDDGDTGGDGGADTFDQPADDGGTNTSSPGDDDGEVGDDDGVDDGDGTDDGAGFIMPPDGGVTGQCDPGQQDCPEGEKCTSYVATPGGETVDSTKCVPIIGQAVAGESCERMTDNDTCALGFFCMTDTSGHTGMGFCLEYCEPGGPPCEYGGECFAFNDGALPVCEVTCDPLLQDCPRGQGCYAAFEDFVCAQPGVSEGGSGQDGDECATIQGCAPGLICRGGTAGCTTESGCCTPICDLSAAEDQCSDPSEDCIAALEDPPPAYQDVGYCAIPE